MGQWLEAWQISMRIQLGRCTLQIPVSFSLSSRPSYLKKFIYLAKHFDCNPETNQILWFSGLPVNVAGTPISKHSLKYLHYLAMKKRGRESGVDTYNGDTEVDRLDIDSKAETPSPMKSRQAEMPSRMRNTLGESGRTLSSSFFHSIHNVFYISAFRIVVILFIIRKIIDRSELMEMPHTSVLIPNNHSTPA